MSVSRGRRGDATEAPMGTSRGRRDDGAEAAVSASRGRRAEIPTEAMSAVPGPHGDAGDDTARPAPENPRYTRYHPRWHRPRVPIMWWLRHRAYVLFISRELTSIFVGYAALLLLALVWALGRGETAYVQFVDLLARPGVLAFHAFVLVALVFHSVTWLTLAPQALPRRIAGRRVDPAVVRIAHYAAWAAVSAALVWVLLGRT